MGFRLSVVFLVVFAVDFVQGQEDAIKKEAYPAKELKELAWLIGKWEHENDDWYNRIEKLEFEWGRGKQVIEVTYLLFHYPGFCENTDFRCSETISVAKKGLVVEFEYKVVAGYAKKDVTGKYSLRPVNEKTWVGEGEHSGFHFTRPEDKSLVKLVKTGESTFEFDSSIAIKDSEDYRFRFKKIK